MKGTYKETKRQKMRDIEIGKVTNRRIEKF